MGGGGGIFILFNSVGSSLPEFSEEPDRPCMISILASASVFAARASSSCLLRSSTLPESILGLSIKKQNILIKKIFD